jgi:hypothetical protein
MKTLTDFVKFIVMLIILTIVFRISIYLFDWVVGGFLGLCLASAVTILCLIRLAK